MTKKRFFELAEEHEIGLELASAFWERRPSDIDDYTEDDIRATLEASKSPIVEQIVGMIMRVREVCEAHEKAQQN